MSLKEIDFCKIENVSRNSEGQKNNIESFDEIQNDCTAFIYIGNIPKNYKSSDLRYFFSDFIEQSAFKCFHYRHRPASCIVKKNDATIETKEVDNLKMCCCIAQIYVSHTDNFIKRFNATEWRNRELEFSKTLVLIKKMKVKESNANSCLFKTRSEIRNEKHLEDQEMRIEDLKAMIEFNPPPIMPNGNVGTPTKYFHKLIRECKMPGSVIKSLGLVFPKNKVRKVYSQVKMTYDSNQSISESDHIVESSDDDCSTENLIKYSSSKQKYVNPNPNNQTHATADNTNTSEEKELDEEDGAEDWERYEALHDDVDNQSRPKERLFEEDLEVKWEKGGSGLVFYTDSFYWNELKGKDFDEDTVDDWDVDYSVYYEDGAGDKPARDQLKMRIENRRRTGINEGPIKYSDLRRKEKRNRQKMMNSFGEFEKFSKQYGSKILKKHGWKDGEGVGSSTKGITEPLDIEGQTSRQHVGLGYHGEKLDHSARVKRKAEKDVYISTIYDEKDDEQINALRYNGQEILKYRPVPVTFQKKKP